MINREEGYTYEAFWQKKETSVTWPWYGTDAPQRFLAIKDINFMDVSLKKVSTVV